MLISDNFAQKRRKIEPHPEKIQIVYCKEHK